MKAAGRDRLAGVRCPRRFSKSVCLALVVNEFVLIFQPHLKICSLLTWKKLVSKITDILRQFGEKGDLLLFREF